MTSQATELAFLLPLCRHLQRNQFRSTFRLLRLLGESVWICYFCIFYVNQIHRSQYYCLGNFEFLLQRSKTLTKYMIICAHFVVSVLLFQTSIKGLSRGGPQYCPASAQLAGEKNSRSNVNRLNPIVVFEALLIIAPTPPTMYHWMYPPLLSFS